jgi:transcriptional antiterminator RfaH
MFVYLDLDEKGNNILRWIEGTHGLVEFGGVPARVPDNLIRELKQRLETIRKAGGLVDVDLKKGDPVRIVDGILEGYEAIFDDRLSGRNRVQVLLSFLSDQPKRVQLGSSQIKKLNH